MACLLTASGAAETISRRLREDRERAEDDWDTAAQTSHFEFAPGFPIRFYVLESALTVF